MLKLGSVPVINENDTVATAEIRYGDNDRLAARVAQMISADCLVLLSDVDGLYTADPTRDPNAQFIPEVRAITPEIEGMAGGSASAVGTGGMATKITAAKIAVGAGCHMCVALGRELHPVRRIEEGARCSWFYPSASPATMRKQWIAGTLQPVGELYVDAGAAAALSRGKSLLPAGVTRVVGPFQRGDALIVRDAAGKEIARGLVAYSSARCRAIAADTNPARSRRCSAFMAATRSSIATIWCSPAKAAETRDALTSFAGLLVSGAWTLVHRRICKSYNNPPCARTGRWSPLLCSAFCCCWVRRG